MGKLICGTLKNGKIFDENGDEITEPSESRFDLLAKMSDEEKHQAAQDDPDCPPMTEVQLDNLGTPHLLKRELRARKNKEK